MRNNCGSRIELTVPTCVDVARSLPLSCIDEEKLSKAYLAYLCAYLRANELANSIEADIFGDGYARGD